MIDSLLEEKIRRKAIDAYPKEAIWLVTEAGCYQVVNVAENPTEAFRVEDSALLQAYQEGLKGIIHSHPDAPACPSEADMRGQIATDVPWGIVWTNGSTSLPIKWWGKGVEKEPLIGRGFCHGITDCYALIKDYYEIELGIDLPEFPRSWNWWNEGDDLYTKGFPVAGFRQIDPDVEPPKKGDMWFTQVRSPVPNHGGVYLGDETVLHHTTAKLSVDPSRISRREPIHRWLPHISHWLRHEEME